MNRPLRVLLFSTLFPSAARPGHGVFVETRLRELRTRQPVQACVVAPVPWFPSTHPRFGEWARMAATPSEESREGVRVLHPRYPLLPKVGMSSAPGLMAAWCFPVLRRLQREGFDFDLIDAHYAYPDGVAAAMLASALGKPLAITARGSDVNLIAQYRWPRALMRWASRRAGASIGVSTALVERLAALGAPPQRLHLLRNGVDLRRFVPVNRADARRTLGLEGEPLLLIVGHLVAHKGQSTAIDTLAALRRTHPRARLCVLGDGPMRHTLEDQARQAGLESAVRFHPAVPQSSLSAWYSAADVLLLASSREGWPNVLLESMACGTPVVCTAVGGTPEIVDAPVAGRLVAPGSSAHDLARALASAVAGLHAAPPERAAVRAHAERFGWAEVSQAQFQLFSRLCTGTGEWARA